MDNNREIITKNAQETAEVGARLAGERPRLVCLYGELGSGKTTFTQGFAKALGVKNRLLSPTFIIVRRYDLPKNLLFYHVDLYRLNSTDEMEELGLSEIFSDPQAFVVVEWADKLGDLLPTNRIDIHFSVVDNEKHKLTITKGN